MWPNLASPLKSSTNGVKNIEELPEKYLEKNSFFDEDKVELEDFEFNQDYDVEDNERSPGWIRYQKRIKWEKKF